MTRAQNEALLWLREINGGLLALTKDLRSPQDCPCRVGAFHGLSVFGLVSISKSGRIVEITKAGEAFNLDGVSMTGAIL
jgi:hypothetical protein